MAGSRWTVEESFQQAKTHTGLDHYQVRTHTAWHRFTALAILALAFLAAQAAAAQRSPRRQGRPNTPEPIALTIGEIHHLLASLALTGQHRPAHTIGWSTWRRRHQGHARWHHYQRREQIEQRR